MLIMMMKMYQCVAPAFSDATFYCALCCHPVISGFLVRPTLAPSTCISLIQLSVCFGCYFLLFVFLLILSLSLSFISLFHDSILILSSLLFSCIYWNSFFLLGLSHILTHFLSLFFIFWLVPNTSDQIFFFYMWVSV